MSDTCDPRDCSPLGSSVHRILQERVLQWVAIFSSRASSWPRDWTRISCSAAAAAAKSLRLCLTLGDPIDGSPSGSPVPGVLQARTLQWVAVSFSNAWKWKGKVLVAQSCLTPSDPMACSPPGSSVHGIFQTRGLEWVPLPSLLLHCQGFFSAEPPGKPLVCLVGKSIHPVLCTSCRIYMIG